MNLLSFIRLKGSFNMPVARHICVCTQLPVTLIGVAYSDQPENRVLNIESRDWYGPRCVLRSVSCSTEVSGVLRHSSWETNVALLLFSAYYPFSSCKSVY